MRAADSKKILTDKERRAVYRPLLSSSNKWNLPHLAIRKMHKIFLSTKIVPNTYHRAESSLRNAAICADVSSRKKRSSGKRGLTENDRQSMIRSNQQRQRSTIRLLVLAISFPWSTLQDAKTKKNARRHSSAVKIGLLLVKARRSAYDTLFLLGIQQKSRSHTSWLFRTFLCWWEVLLFDLLETKFLSPNELFSDRAVECNRYISKVVFHVIFACPRYEDYRKDTLTASLILGLLLW